MKRVYLENLATWIEHKNRKPLIIRGARQVGKSTLVKIFCEEQKLDLIEINLELISLNNVKFEQFDLNKLLDEIQLLKNKRITDKSLLFFDEIQESPPLLKLLRYFYEQRPDLKVICAGSLLEFSLKSESFSFPVGRVDFLHVHPMTFQEFLWANKLFILDEKIKNFDFTPEVHQAALSALQNYYLVGGMPEAVKRYIESKSVMDAQEIHSQLIQSFQADFPKYGKKINVQRVARIFRSVTLKIGEKVIYSKLDLESKSRETRKALELLIDARLVLACNHSDGNAVPLRAESDDRVYKLFFLDVGLLCSTMGVRLELIYNNLMGTLAEQFVAQHLNAIHRDGPELFYHLKDKGIQKAEIDFLLEDGAKIYPIEVKSSATGHLKSLRYFIDNKISQLAFKLSTAQYSEETIVGTQTKLINLPLYAVGYLPFFLNKNKSQ